MSERSCCPDDVGRETSGGAGSGGVAVTIAPTARQGEGAAGPQKGALGGRPWWEAMPQTRNCYLDFTPPRIVGGARGQYFEFYTRDPEADLWRRHRLSVPAALAAHAPAARQEYLRAAMSQLMEMLLRGWRPRRGENAIGSKNRQATPEDPGRLKSIIATYRRDIAKRYKDGALRRDSYVGYASYAKNFEQYAKKRGLLEAKPEALNVKFYNDFLEHIWQGRDNSAQTRDNYLRWVRQFEGYMAERGFIGTEVTRRIRPLKRRGDRRKERTGIPEHELARLKRYLEQEGEFGYLMAVKIIYYCNIRPLEMSFIQIKDINFDKSTLTIHGDRAKNHQTQVVTIPDKLLQAMVDAGYHTRPQSNFLFSTDFLPGARYRDGKCFRDRWLIVAKKLNFPSAYKFYSLKDSGITSHIRAGVNMLAVRNQARHHSLEETDRYTPASMVDADPAMLARNDDFM